MQVTPDAYALNCSRTSTTLQNSSNSFHSSENLGKAYLHYLFVVPSLVKIIMDNKIIVT